MPRTGKIISPERLEQLRLAGIKGGLAKRGKMSARKLKEMQVNAAIKQRALQLADNALNAVAVAAFGSYIVAELVLDVETGKRNIVPVRDMDYVSSLLTTGENGIDYLIIEGTAPDLKAAVELLDRGVGKSKETLEVQHTFSLTALAKERRQLEALPEPTPVSFRELSAPPEGV